ncbi:uncharacterized protein N7458_005287 [Penicillium daleae]|uniref:Uncharacterized protein n=1 Tax=Penicillium daleae TaxID=63821 RepID=A0AAD6G3D7_9EURO|nr:uncharacterized protein N7458_005287 [Penicillium daleae]KAJ5454331.1 hypothetical protein N7458_005287 [Penicillium daleae]
MQLKPYADIALINAMLSSATAEDDFDKAQATVSAILHYYFLIADGFLVTFHSGTPQKLPHYFLIRRMDKNEEEIRLWAVLFMPKEGESTDWVDQLYQMLQTGIPGIPERRFRFEKSNLNRHEHSYYLGHKRRESLELKSI